MKKVSKELEAVLPLIDLIFRELTDKMGHWNMFDLDAKYYANFDKFYVKQHKLHIQFDFDDIDVYELVIPMKNIKDGTWRDCVTEENTSYIYDI